MKIFITGVSSGIGRAIAMQSAQLGHEVWGLARRRNLLEELQRDIGSALTISVADVTSVEDMTRVAAQMRQEGFIPDVVVLNAGTQLQDVEDGLVFSQVQHSLRTNVEGPLFWVAEFLPEFLKRNSGSFVAISSTAAYRPIKDFVAYPATKTALSMAFRGLRLNFADSAVVFSTVHLGPVATDMWKGKISFLVASRDEAARFIISIFRKRSSSYFFPFLSTSLLRMTNFLPDGVFSFVSRMLN